MQSGDNFNAYKFINEFNHLEPDAVNGYLQKHASQLNPHSIALLLCAETSSKLISPMLRTIDMWIEEDKLNKQDLTQILLEILKSVTKDKYGSINTTQIRKAIFFLERDPILETITSELDKIDSIFKTTPWGESNIQSCTYFRGLLNEMRANQLSGQRIHNKTAAEREQHTEERRRAVEAARKYYADAAAAGHPLGAYISFGAYIKVMAHCVAGGAFSEAANWMEKINALLRASPDDVIEHLGAESIANLLYRSVRHFKNENKEHQSFEKNKKTFCQLLMTNYLTRPIAKSVQSRLLLASLMAMYPADIPMAKSNQKGDKHLIWSLQYACEAYSREAKKEDKSFRTIALNDIKTYFNAYLQLHMNEQEKAAKEGIDDSSLKFEAGDNRDDFSFDVIARFVEDNLVAQRNQRAIEWLELAMMLPGFDKYLQEYIKTREASQRFKEFIKENKEIGKIRFVLEKDLLDEKEIPASMEKIRNIFVSLEKSVDEKKEAAPQYATFYQEQRSKRERHLAGLRQAILKVGNELSHEQALEIKENAEELLGPQNKGLFAKAQREQITEIKRSAAALADKAALNPQNITSRNK